MQREREREMDARSKCRLQNEGREVKKGAKEKGGGEDEERVGWRLLSPHSVNIAPSEHCMPVAI